MKFRPFVVVALALLAGAAHAESRILTVREQAEVIDGWLADRVNTVLPALMRRNDIDLWLIISREYNEDPVIRTFLPATWMAARRTTSLPAPFVVAGLFVLATPVFFIPLAAVYRVLRPAETLAEATERDLTETALEATPTKDTCPSCGSAIEEDWRLCPWCRAELLVPCPRCTRPVSRDWSVCPWCVRELPWGRAPVPVFAGEAPPPERAPSWDDWAVPWAATGTENARSGATRSGRRRMPAAVGGPAPDDDEPPMAGANGRTHPPATLL